MAGVIGGISLAVITVRNYEPYESKFDILISKPKIYISFYLRTAKHIGMHVPNYAKVRSNIPLAYLFLGLRAK